MKIKRSHLRNGLILLHLAFAITGFYLFTVNYHLSETQLTQKALTKQAILAKAGSSSIENLIKNVQNQLSSFVFSFAPVSEIVPINIAHTRLAFDEYIQRAQLPINGVALYDENGTLVILGNRQHNRTGEGQNFAQTSYIQWSKNPANRGKTYISTPYIGTTGASIGKTIIIVAQPIYFGNTYKGTLVIKLLVDDFRKSFIDALASDPAEDSFIITNKGLLLAGNGALINQNLFSYAQNQKWSQYKDFTQKLATVLKANRSQAVWTFQNPKEKPRVVFVGISKIDIPNTDNDLYIITNASRDDALASLQPLRLYGFAWLGFGLLASVLGGIIAVLL